MNAMNAVTQLRNQAEPKMFPLLKSRKALAILGACLLLSSAIFVYELSAGESREPISTSRTGGSDKMDLSISRPETPFAIRGKVTINRQFPLANACIVAYDRTKTHATAFAKSNNKGEYQLVNLPPFPLTLLVKKRITDDPNPFFLQASPKAMNGIPRKWRDGEKAGPPTSAILKRKPPTNDQIAKIRFDELLPQFEHDPCLEWLTEEAFLKYGLFSKTEEPFQLDPTEGNKTYDLNLQVP